MNILDLIKQKLAALKDHKEKDRIAIASIAFGVLTFIALSLAHYQETHSHSVCEAVTNGPIDDKGQAT